MTFNEWSEKYRKAWGARTTPRESWIAGRLELLDELRKHPRIGGLGLRQSRSVQALLDEFRACECGAKEDDRG